MHPRRGRLDGPSNLTKEKDRRRRQETNEALAGTGDGGALNLGPH